MSPYRTYWDRAARIRAERGVWGLLVLVIRRLVSPAIAWGGITFFARELDGSSAMCSEVPDISVRRFTACDIREVRPGIDPTQGDDEIARRFRQGDWAFAAIESTGRAAHSNWVSRSRAHIPEIARDVVLAPHQAYFYNGYTRPEFRKRGIDGFVRDYVYRTAHAHGCTRIYSYARRDNPSGLRAAARSQQPIGTLWYVRIRPWRPLVLSTSWSQLPTLTKASND